MAKRIRWSNNERVDVPDLQAATSGGDTPDAVGFAEAEARRLTVETVLTKYPAVLEGFRVEVPDQIASPGEFTVHNAFAYDRAGRILNDESEPDAARSYTLPAPNTQYFLEAEFTLIASDVDARAFWDQTYDNGTQQSGDPEQPGREFALNVSTRMTPTWKIVTPVSVAGFEIDTNPNSKRVPIATLETGAGGEIINVTKKFEARSVLAEDYPIGATSIRIHNSRIFPDTFSLDIVQLVPPAAPVSDVVTVTANDRANGILTLAAPGLAIAHYAGERVYNADLSPPQFIGESDRPSFVPSSDSRDARPRLWAADEHAGFVTLRDPNLNAGYTDTQIATMRDEINALAASIREMRWGGFIDPDANRVIPYQIGQYAQASGFNASPRWFEPAGGIQGAKTCTVSVGDNKRSFGDYNTDSYPSPADAIQAAIDRIAEASSLGGTLYIKRSASAYTMNTLAPATVSIPAFTKGLTIIGDGDMTELQMNIAQPFFTLAANAKVHFENLKITRSNAIAAATEPAILAGANAKITSRSFYADGIESSVGLAGGKIYVDLADSTIASTGFHANMIGLWGQIDGVASNCTIAGTVDNPAARATKLTSGSNFRARDCKFISAGVNPTSCVEQGTSSVLELHSCSVANAGVPAGWNGVYVPGGAISTVLDNCSMTSLGGVYSLLDATNVTELSVVGCNVTYPADSSAIKFRGGRATVRDCKFIQSVDGITGKAIYFYGGDSVEIDNVYLENADYGIVNDNVAASTYSLGIKGVTYKNSIVNAGIAAIKLTCDGLYGCTISGCVIDGVKNAGATSHGILIHPATEAEGVCIDGNRITNIIGATNSYGIQVIGDVTGLSVVNNSIGGKTASSLNATAGTIGISIVDNGATPPTDLTISNNKLMNIDGAVTVRGIDISSANGLTCGGNVIGTLGNAATTGSVYGIAFGWNGAVSGAQESSTFTGNSVRRLFCDGLAGNYGIGIYSTISSGKVTIASNTIADCGPTAGGYGILVDGQNNVADYIQDMVISGNSIATSNPAVYKFRDCINIQDVIGAPSNGRFVITGNTVSNFYGSGIRAYPSGLTSLQDLVVSNNVIHTPIKCVAGLSIGSSFGFAITGNTIDLTLVSQDQHGIYMPDADTNDGIISSNLVKVNDPVANFYGIWFNGVKSSISSNSIWTSTGATRNMQSIYLGQGQLAYCVIMSNQFQVGGNLLGNIDPRMSVTPNNFMASSVNGFQAVSNFGVPHNDYNLNYCTFL